MTEKIQGQRWILFNFWGEYIQITHTLKENGINSEVFSQTLYKREEIERNIVIHNKEIKEVQQFCYEEVQ